VGDDESYLVIYVDMAVSLPAAGGCAETEKGDWPGRTEGRNDSQTPADVFDGHPVAASYTVTD